LISLSDMRNFKLFMKILNAIIRVIFFRLLLKISRFFVSNYAITFFLNFLLKECFYFLTDAYTKLANGASVGVL